MATPESSPVRLRLVVTGRVQGVGFRYSTVHEARRLGLLGWVRNCREGGVEILAEGSRERLEQLAIWSHDGPRGALVSNVCAEWGVPTGEFTSFSVRY
jgi:acylphosphatase